MFLSCAIEKNIHIRAFTHMCMHIYIYIYRVYVVCIYLLYIYITIYVYVRMCIHVSTTCVCIYIIMLKVPHRIPYKALFQASAPASDDDNASSRSKAASDLAESAKEHKKRMARLRRVCEIKKNGNCHVPHFLHQQWASNSNRDELLEQLEKVGWDTDACLKLFCKSHDAAYIQLQFNPVRVRFDHVVFFNGSIHPATQDKFVDVMTTIRSTKEEKKNKIAEGWYSKEDMRTELKWHPHLGKNSHAQSTPHDPYEIKTGPRKKIEGAIRSCQADPDNLVRTVHLRSICKVCSNMYMQYVYIREVLWQDGQIRGRGRVLGDREGDWIPLAVPVH